MKAKILSVLLLASSLVLVGCTGTSDQNSNPSDDIVSQNTSSPDSSADFSLDALWTDYDTTTIAELKELATEEESDVRYFVKGEIVSIDDYSYGQMTIKDDTGSIMVYGARGSDGKTYFDQLEDKPKVGDFVLLSATIKTYNNTPEIYIGWILDFKTPAGQEEIFDESKYQAMTIAEARKAEKGDLVKVKGVVAQFTYNNKLGKIGFLLVDSSSSIYVYDTPVSNEVAIGNEIEICATKDYWILEDEQGYAEKWGYKGANQLTEVHLISNDEKTNTVDFTGAVNTTVKDLMDTPSSEDITSLVYHSTAVVKKVENPGYTNYYIDDLDGRTGSYCYTQANGNDYSWLDEFDGKVCDVYYTALNAKSTDTGTVWRLVPIQVEAIENFAFDQNEAAEFAIEYYAAEQFAESYRADPAMEVIATASSDYVDLSNVRFSYSSSDETAAWFEEKDGKTIFHVNPETEKQVTITVTATNGEYESATRNIDITVSEKPTFENVKTVKEVVDSAVGTECIVEGVVGPSLSNKVGFYLIDDTGLIAVQTASDGMEGLAIGQTVTMSGKRAFSTKDDATGQIYLDEAKVEYNEFGSTPYPTNTFVTDKTLADIYDFNVEDTFHTAEAYVLEDVHFAKVGNQYYTNYYVESGDKKIQLYSGNQSQYAFLDDYIDVNVDVEVAPCNWNSKNYFTLSLLSFTTEDGTQVFNTYRFGK